MEEKILVVPRDKLFEAMEESPQGFGTERLQEFLEIIGEHNEFVARREAEKDPSLKQIIPYMVLCFGSRLFLMRRFDNQDEERLRNLYSLGVGGHINHTDDISGKNVLTEGLKRELQEEVIIQGNYELQPTGYINDDSNAVGQVHFGLAYKVEVMAGEVEIREKDIMSGSFVTVAEAQSVYPEMETWSQIVLKNIDAFLPAIGEVEQPEA